MVLKLDQYAQWLYFDAVNFPLKWYEGAGTVPMREAMIWIGASVLLFMIINIYNFRVAAIRELKEQEEKV